MDFLKSKGRKTKLLGLRDVQYGTQPPCLPFISVLLCLQLKEKDPWQIFKKQEFKIIFKLIKGVFGNSPHILRKDYQQYFVLQKKNTISLLKCLITKFIFIQMLNPWIVFQIFGTAEEPKVQLWEDLEFWAILYQTHHLPLCLEE